MKYKYYISNIINVMDGSAMILLWLSNLNVVKNIILKNRSYKKNMMIKYTGINNRYVIN